MKKAVYILLAVSIICSPVFADQGSKICNYTINNFGLATGLEVPDGIPYTDEVFNFYTFESQKIGSMVLAEGKLKSFGCELEEKPTYNVYLESKQTVKDIYNARNEIKTANEKLDKGEIKIQATSIQKQIKLGFTLFTLKVFSWFGA